MLELVSRLRYRLSAFIFLIALASLGAIPAAAQCVSLTTTGSAYTQNFDTLSNTAGSTTNNLTIPGWFMTEGGGGARDNEQYAVDTGGSTTGDTYSYGAAGSTERALGQLRSGTLIPLFGSCYTNNTGTTITSLDIAYNGEEWRLGTAGRTDQMNFEYSTNATDLVTGTWTNVAALNFVTPDTATTGAKNGNAAADRTAKSATISALSIANGATFWIRWNDTDASGADDGLAVDDFSLTPQVGAPLPNLTINDVSLNEGNAGTTSFTFTVSLSAPAGPGGVTFDIATADGTSTQPSDYTQKSLTGQTIPAGSSTYAFTVLVNGDTTPETNETFFVNVTNVTGASVTDGQGQGTIVNDDVAPNLTINDVTLTEGNAGTTTFTFTVSLSAPAPAGGVTFDIATANNSAVAPGDYTAKSLTSQTIPAGSSTYTFDVLVNGDTTPENGETFFVNVTNVTNAIVTDGQGLGTISNDDTNAIHDVQGNGNTSPLVGSSVIVRGIVTAVKSNGFFLQEPEAEYDADPNTSEGILVFTNAAPTVVVGADVQVTATVAEFTPSSSRLTLTELTSPSVVVISNGNTLPSAILLTAADLSPIGSLDQLERYEGMRVQAASLTTVAGTEGSVDQANASATTFGSMHVVLTGTPRPYREPGRSIDVPLPSGAPANVPVFDENPEAFRIDSDAAGQPTLDLNVGSVIADVVGPLDYAFGDYTIDATSYGAVTPADPARAAAAPAANQATVAVYNIERFFDTTDDSGISDVALTPAAFDRRLNKASDGVRNYLRFPDVVGFVEVENLTTLQAIATRINSDAVSNAQPNPNYVAYLLEGNDVGGIDVGYLVKTAEVRAGVPRVTVNSVTQVNPSATYINPSTSVAETLHDRPSLRLDAIINDATLPSFPITVINNHLRSLTGADTNDASGNRIRVKRRAQAEDIANYVQSIQTSSPTTRVMMIGDFNAFEFNDGLVDTIGTLIGNPTPADQVVLASSDLVNPNLVVLDNTLPANERYSFEFAGHAQSLDHILVNQALLNDATVSMDHARLNADQRETNRNLSTAQRLADHDPAIAYITLPDPGAFSFSLESYEVNENGVTATITVNRGPGTDGAVSVDYTTIANSATAGADYTTASGTLNFADGDSSKTFTVSILDDSVYEGDENLGLQLSNPTGGATIDGANAGLTILDNETEPTLSVSDVNVNEAAGTATVTVTLSGPASYEITADYATADSSATAGSDYTATSGTLTFAAGDTSKSFTVSITNDILDEADETFFVNLTNPDAVFTDSQALITIADDDATPTISVNDVSIAENGLTATLTVTLTGASQSAVLVNYATADGTATSGSDYSATSGTLTFPSNANASTQTQTVNVTILDDSNDELDETVLFNLTNPSNATISDNQGVLTIVDDDGAPSLIINDVNVTEGNAGTSTVTLTVSLVGSTSQTVMVDYATADGTATAGSDYVATNGTLTFNPGTTSLPIVVTINGDTVDEADETVLVNLTNATNATISDKQGVATITDDDGAPTLSINDNSVLETNAGTTTVTLTVSLAGSTSQVVTVNYATADGTATAGSDYVATSGTLTFNPGTTSLPITITVNGDVTNEPNETILVNLSNAVNATITDNQGVATITNDDGAPTLSINDVSLAEGNAGNTAFTFTVTLTGSTAQTVTVNYATADGTATAGSDYAATSGTLTFAPGITTQQVTVNVAGDSAVEADETFFVNLTSPSGATLTDAQGLGTAVNDDAAVILNADLTVSTTYLPASPIGGGQVTYTITVGNNGPAAATGLVLTDAIPAGTTLVSANATQGSCSGTTAVTCTLGGLASGSNAVVTIVVQLPPTGGTFSNVASADSIENDANGATATTTFTAAAAADIPTLNQWALMLLAGALLAGATLRMRS